MKESVKSSASQAEAAFAGAAERFLAMIRVFWTQAATAGGKSQDSSSLARKLSEELEYWLRSSTSIPPVYGSGAAFTSSPWSTLPFGPLLHGSDQGRGQQRMVRLTKRLTRVQGRLESHWREIAATAARQFVARLKAQPVKGLKFENAMAIYQLWIDCAEQAYGRAIRKEDFCRVQAELTNAITALVLEQRTHAETLARALGIPTRNEIDSLSKRVRELQRELGALRMNLDSDVPKVKRKRVSRSRSVPP
jgi:hypothetical protein